VLQGYHGDITRQSSSLVVIPSHAQVQRILVEAGDKPLSFIGSKQWIGAVELSIVFKRLFNVHLGSIAMLDHTYCACFSLTDLLCL
jgi:hypothetical protein